MRIAISLCAALILCAQGPAFAQDSAVDNYRVTPGIVYGTGLVRTGGETAPRDLRIDVWQPAEANGALPASVPL